MIRLFAHRGFWQENLFQNSISSLKAAYEKRFRAIEFDIWLCGQSLLLKHDQPQPEENLPKLSDYFQFHNELIYWLDFKNMDEDNALEIFEKVRSEVIKNKIDESRIYLAPFITDFELAQKILKKARSVFGSKIKFMAVCEDKELLENLPDFLQKNSIPALSIFHELLDEKLIKKLEGIEVFAWTVNDLNRIFALQKLGIKNFATDKITPQIYEEAAALSRTSFAS